MNQETVTTYKTKPKYFKKKTKPKKENLDIPNLKPQEDVSKKQVQNEPNILEKQTSKPQESKKKPKVAKKTQKKVTKKENVDIQNLKEEKKPEVSKPVKKVFQTKKSPTPGSEINPKIVQTNKPKVSKTQKAPIPKKKFKPVKKCNDCPNQKETENKLNKFKELKRYFGHYHCGRCHKEWKSGNSVKNMYQECKKCKKKVVPHELIELEKFKSEKTKDHEESLCEACQNNLGICNIQIA
jgi:hypothetical protein